jgi:HEAT repeat protein
MNTARVLCALLLSACVTAEAQTSSSASCPAPGEDIRVSALGVIMQTESDQVVPVLQKVLDRKDECSIELRRQVVSFLTRAHDPSRIDIMLRVARTDPSAVVRRQAVQSLSQVRDERASAALDSIVFNTTDAELQDAALRAIPQQQNPVARASIRRIAESTTLPIELRARALGYIGYGRRDADDLQYLEGLYGKTASPQLREGILRAVSSQRSPESSSWLMGVVRDRNSDIELRKSALRAVSNSIPSPDSRTTNASGLEVKDLLGLYKEFNGQTELQEQLLDVYSNRPEAASTDTLLQIAQDESNVNLRKRAVSRLGHRKDPRVTQFLIDLVNK